MIRFVVPALLALIVHWPAHSFAQSEEFKRLDSMENAVAAAYDGFDLDLHEKLLNDLLGEYKRTHRTQEEIWLLYANGMDREAQELERKLRLQLKTSDLAEGTVQPLAGSRVYKARLSSGHWVVVRAPIKDQRDPQFEAMVYELDRLLGFHIVPVTTSITFNGILCSVQPFLAEMKPGHLDFRQSPYDDERLHILDFLISHMDRHRGNWGTVPGGHRVALDNDMIRGIKSWEIIKRAGLIFSSDHPPRTIKPGNRKVLERLKNELNNPNIRAKFQTQFLMGVEERIDSILKFTAPTDCTPDLSRQ